MHTLYEIDSMDFASAGPIWHVKFIGLLSSELATNQPASEQHHITAYRLFILGQIWVYVRYKNWTNRSNKWLRKYHTVVWCCQLAKFAVSCNNERTTTLSSYLVTCWQRVHDKQHKIHKQINRKISEIKQNLRLTGSYV